MKKKTEPFKMKNPQKRTTNWQGFTQELSFNESWSRNGKTNCQFRFVTIGAMLGCNWNENLPHPPTYPIHLTPPPPAPSPSNPSRFRSPSTLHTFAITHIFLSYDHPPVCVFFFHHLLLSLLP